MLRSSSIGLSLLVLTAPLAARQTVTLPARATPLTERPTTLFSIGKEEGESWELLSSVTALAFDRHANLYVLDSGNRRVLVFDSAGAFIRAIGAQGQGPGEFTAPMGLAVLRTGDLVVSDILRGFAVFGPDGTYRHQIPPSESDAGIGGSGIQADPRGGIMVRTTRGPTLADGAIPDRMPPQSITSIPLTDEGRPAANGPTQLHEIRSEGGMTIRAERGGRMRTFAPSVFEPQFSWGVLPDGGIAVTESTAYSILVKDASGRLVRTLTRTGNPRRVTEADREAAREQRRRTLSGEESGAGVRIAVMASRGSAPQVSYGGAGLEMSREQIEEQVRNMTFAEVMPMIRALTTDPLGRIWVERTGAKVGEQGPIELITADGRYIGTIMDMPLPRAVDSRGTRAAWIERDALGIERVIVRRLPESWRQARD